MTKNYIISFSFSASGIIFDLVYHHFWSLGQFVHFRNDDMASFVKWHGSALDRVLVWIRLSKIIKKANGRYHSNCHRDWYSEYRNVHFHIVANFGPSFG